MTVDIIDLKTEITFPEVSEDEIRALVKVKCTAELQETDGVVPIHDAAVMEEVEEHLSNELISELILVVRRAQNELRSDFIGFHKQFSIAYPKQWKELEENWCEVFSNIAIAYDVDVKIMRQVFYIALYRQARNNYEDYHCFPSDNLCFFPNPSLPKERGN